MMDLFFSILTILILASAALAIRAREKGQKIPLYVFKPLTTVLIILFVVRAGQTDWTPYFYWIAAGLIFCLFGDVFLMFAEKWFVTGLVGFLIGHLFYILTFTSGFGFGLTPWFFVPIGLYGIALYSILFPHLAKLKIPVLVYVVVIIVMVWQAWERWHRVGGQVTLLASLGAAFFLISDTVLAMNRFRKGFKGAHTLSLSTYYVAQWLIAYSVRQ